MTGALLTRSSPERIQPETAWSPKHAGSSFHTFPATVGAIYPAPRCAPQPCTIPPSPFHHRLLLSRSFDCHCRSYRQLVRTSPINGAAKRCNYTCAPYYQPRWTWSLFPLRGYTAHARFRFADFRCTRHSRVQSRYTRTMAPQKHSRIHASCPLSAKTFCSAVGLQCSLDLLCYVPTAWTWRSPAY